MNQNLFSISRLGFLMESGYADQYVSKHCDSLTRIQDKALGNRHYAMAFPKGSPYADAISRQILNYNENGRLSKLRNKWFRHRCRSKRGGNIAGKKDENGKDDVSQINPVKFSKN